MRTMLVEEVAAGDCTGANEFMWRYMRSFVMQEHERSKPLPETVEADSDIDEAWAQACRELNRLECMSLTTASMEQALERHRIWEGYQLYEAGRAQRVQRLKDMRASLSAVETSTGLLASILRQLIDDLDKAIEHERPLPAPDEDLITAAEWLSRRRVEAERTRSSAFARMLKAKQTALDLTELLVATRKALGYEPARPTFDAVGADKTPTGIRARPNKGDSRI